MSSRRAKLDGLLWIAAFAALAFVIAAGEPFFVRRIPFRFEQRVGQELASHDDDVCSTKAGSAALAKLVGRIFPLDDADKETPIRVRVVNSDEVNAYAFLGGLITVNDALLREAHSPEELAGVLAHEMEHVRRRHVLEGLFVQLGTWGAVTLLTGGSDANVARMLAGLQFTKGQEREADEGGLNRLVKASVDTSGFAEFFERAHARGGYGFLSDHPSDSSRASRARSMNAPAHHPVLTPKEWRELQQICD